ncbi:MFS transporter [Dyadobacter sp. CY345]|uniref:MFS transporter n=1 Tax=Dyadobacter sp. CY345 TaxID=2909335 RepID=UPI0038D45C8E
MRSHLRKELSITTVEFALIVSAHSCSTGPAGLLAAGFADMFDRKKLLLFFYARLIAGTLLCGSAPNYHFLPIARIVTGIFCGQRVRLVSRTLPIYLTFGCAAG